MRTRRGTILMMALLLVMVIGLVGRAVILIGPGALALSSNSAALAQAKRAAESGFEYAAAKLRENPDWKGTGKGLTVNSPGFCVLEDQGNIIGLLTDPEGNVSQFRLRFNYQDGDPGADGLPDPVSWLKDPLVSLNNLKGTKEVPIPVADAQSGRVLDPTTGPHNLAKGSVYLAVEGRAGRGLSHLTSADPNGPTPGPVSRYQAEAYYQTSLTEASAQASMMGGGDISFKMSSKGRVDVRVKNNDAVVPRLRSKGSVSVDSSGTPGQLQIVQGEIGRDANKPPGFSAQLLGTATLVQESVGDGKDFFNLKWDEVTKADPSPSTNSAHHLPGGTYVHWDDGSIHYYDMKLADYQTYMSVPANQSDPGVVLSSNCKEVRDPANLAANSSGLKVSSSRNPYTSRWSSKWEIDKDLYVKASASGVQSLSVIPRSGAAFGPQDQADTVTLTKPDIYTPRDITFQLEGAIISSDDDINLFAHLDGRDSTITSGGTLKLITSETQLESLDKNGKSLVEVLDSQLQLNLYVKKDIKISTFDRGSFKRLKLEGLVYSWGDFIAKVGDSGLNKWGEFELNGAVVAYGADPSSGEPGSSGGGRIDVTAGEAKITWDDKKMAPVAQLGTSTVTLRRSLYNHR